MYTGTWEVVGKNKKDKNPTKNGKLSKAEKKKFIENAPKVEDFLPLDQVKTLYDNLEGNREIKKSTKEKESKTKENEEKKKQQKQQQHQQQQSEKKKEEPPKEKPPKSIEEALILIDVAEVQDLLETNQARFPDAPLVWLKTLVAFLNAKIPLKKHDPLFTGRPDGYPLNVMPKNLRVVFEKAIESAGDPSGRLFYEFLLTAMTVEMFKEAPVTGYQLFIQLLSAHDANLNVANIPKLISMRNSYQNRKQIGLLLLWSFSQAGREDLNSGLKVWHEVMAPMLEAKSYSSYVMQILKDLLTWHKDDKSLHSEMYLNILDDFFSGKLNISSSVIDEGIPCLEQLRLILLQNKTINHRKLFEALLGKVTSKTSENYTKEIEHALIGFLIADSRCFSTWKSLYMKYSHISSILMKHIKSNWDELQSSLNTKLLLELLTAIELSHEKAKKSKGKDYKNIYTCSTTAGEIRMKMSSKKSSKGGFPWKTGCFLLLLLIGAIIAYDTHKYGSFEATRAGKFMRDSGINAYAQKTWVSTKLYSGKGLEYLEASSPEYYKAVVDFSTPYIKLAGEFYLIARNVSIKLYKNFSTYVATNTPVVVATVEHYVPGLLESVQKNSVKGVEIVKTYSTLIAEQAIENSVKATRWLKTNVFVGKLSPESLQNYANQAINTTHTFASQTYDWVYEKVQTLSKVE